MNSNINAHCRVCGQGYHRCNSCDQLQTFNTWRSVADTPNCYKIYNTLYLVNLNKITTEEAKKELSNCDLTDIEHFVPSVKDKINSIMNFVNTETDLNVISEDTENVESSEEYRKGTEVPNKEYDTVNYSSNYNNEIILPHTNRKHKKR